MNADVQVRIDVISLSLGCLSLGWLDWFSSFAAMLSGSSSFISTNTPLLIFCTSLAGMGAKLDAREKGLLCAPIPVVLGSPWGWVEEMGDTVFIRLRKFRGCWFQVLVRAMEIKGSNYM
jgi:hypothetical protein